jgi:TonB-dependent SusC/RagA subfamily outer membrane receptor
MDMKHIIAVITGMLLAAGAVGQTRVVRGKLTTFNTYPVQNVEVQAKKAGTSALSDSTGQFSIVCMEEDVIRIRPKAFKQVSVKVGPDTDSLLVNLIFINTKKNREIAVGYGYMDEDDLSYAVSNLQQENNEYCNYSNIYELIRGRFAGVEVENGQVIIRGNRSFYGPNEALYVVDGIIVNSIDWISPCDVKSINILKDSAAAAYGSRGANGVVIIDLKRAE